MKKINLGGKWLMKRTDSNTVTEATVPGSIYTDMLSADMLPDPYYRDNADIFEEVMEHDYLYTHEFFVDRSDIDCKRVRLVCEGLDTLCEITVNGVKIADTDNMHRKWIFDVKNVITAGKNEISILIKSPVNYCRSKYADKPLAQNPDAICLNGYPYLRKAHCMLGWDWGPKLPDGGIWKDIYLMTDNGFRLDSVFVTQTHTEDGKVFINVLPEPDSDSIDIKYTADFDGQIYTFDNSVQIEVQNPRLWYPVGYGEQNLYDFKLRAESMGETDEYSCRIGLRVCELVKDNDEYGTSMYFRVNGIPVFAKGSNYVPEDSILTRCSRERTYNLLKQAVKGNQNIIRVWGGAFFPHDYFFDICDELGLLVWQDLMFACAQYPNTPEFYESIARETEDNVKRIRNHACLALWCGNNECETALKDWWNLPQKDLDDYIVQYSHVLKNAVQKCDPTRPYQASSPTSHENFEDISDENIGDVHYWDVWFKQAPLSSYLDYHFRFLSEFGFQSLPCIETINEFTAEEDRNIFSRVMEKHQRDGAANGKILLYLSRDFKYPKNLDSLAYVSQILQAEAVRAGVEHMRRNRNNFRSMGAIYWQLNDCWPVASWSGIDYYGRLKALHYSSVRFFKDVLLSAVYDDKNTVLISLTNDLTENIRKKVYYAIKTQDGDIIKYEEKEITADALSSADVFTLNTSGADIYNQYIEYGMDGKMSGAVLLCPNKHFNYKNPNIKYSIAHSGNKTVIKLSCDSLAAFTELKAKNNTAEFSDNYFFLSPNEEREITCDEYIEDLSVRSVYDTY